VQTDLETRFSELFANNFKAVCATVVELQKKIEANPSRVKAC